MLGSFVPFVNQVMDSSALQRNLIADNISNSNTPNYKAKKLKFEDTLQTEMKLSLKGFDHRHIGNKKNLLHVPEQFIYEDTKTKTRVDGNNVDTTNEMIDMIRNNYVFNNSVHAINKEFSLHKLAIGRM